MDIVLSNTYLSLKRSNGKSKNISNSKIDQQLKPLTSSKNVEKERKKRQKRWTRIETKLYSSISYYKTHNKIIYENEFENIVNKIIDEKKFEHVDKILSVMQKKLGTVPKLKKEEVIVTTISEKRKLNTKATYHGISNDNLAQIFLCRCITDYLKPKWLCTSNRKMNSQHLIMKIKMNEQQYDDSINYLPGIHNFFNKCMFKIRQDVTSEEEFWRPFYKVNKCYINDTYNDFPKYSEDILKLSGNDLKPYLLLNTSQMAQLLYPSPFCEGNDNFIKTRECYDKITSKSPFYTIDCEMVNTDQGYSKLARFSLIDQEGTILMDTLVKPKGKITDYLTKYSGIVEGMLDDIDVTIEDIQEYLCKVLPPDAILVGHTLNCDLNALNIYHPYISDISALYNYGRKIENRISLKKLGESFLNKSCQNGAGHCSVEDSLITMDLYKKKLKYGLGYGNYHYSKKENNMMYKNDIDDGGSDSSESTNEIPKKKEKIEGDSCFMSKTRKVICKGCKRVITIPCVIKGCDCFERIKNNCIKCFNKNNDVQINRDEKPISWDALMEHKKIENEDVGDLAEFLESKSNKKIGHHVLFAGKGFSKWLNKSKYIHILDSGNLKTEFDMLLDLRYQICEYSSMAISVNMENELEINKINTAIEWIIDGLSHNGLFVCILESPNKKCLYLRTKSNNNK
uniref:Exonuclease domain-containing protein n=1 Tax=Parastrongyloides trichosuri TaxID=131310 RepID=A0A0N4ZPX3_PARTI